MKSKWLNITIIGLLIINLGTLVLLWTKPGPPGPPPHGPGGHGPKGDPLMHHLKDEVGFSEDQLADFRTIQEDAHQQRMEIQEENRLLRQEQISSIATDSLIDNSGLIGANIAQLESIGVNVFSQTRGLCTPDQLESFDQLLERLGKHMMPPPPGPGPRGPRP